MFDMNLAPLLKDHATSSITVSLLLSQTPFYMANVVFR